MSDDDQKKESVTPGERDGPADQKGSARRHLTAQEAIRIVQKMKDSPEFIMRSGFSDISRSINNLAHEIKSDRIFKVTGLLPQDDLRTLNDLDEAGQLPPLNKEIQKQLEEFQSWRYGKSSQFQRLDRDPNLVDFKKNGFFFREKSIARPKTKQNFILQMLFKEFQKQGATGEAKPEYLGGITLDKLTELLDEKSGKEPGEATVNPKSVQKFINRMQVKFEDLFPDLGREGLIRTIKRRNASSLYALTDEAKNLSSQPRLKR